MPSPASKVLPITSDCVFLQFPPQVVLEILVCDGVFAPYSVQELMPENEEVRFFSLRASFHEDHVFDDRNGRAADARRNGRTVLENDHILPENTPDLFQPERRFAVLPHRNKLEVLLIHAEFGRRMPLELVQDELFVSLFPLLRLQSVRPRLGFRRNPALLTRYGPKQLPLYSLSPISLQCLALLSFSSSGYRLSHFSMSSIQKLISSSFRRSS